MIIKLFITIELLLRIRYLNCSNEIIFKNIKIRPTEETLNEIIYNNKSISRFGDGEFLLAIGKNIPFQKCQKKIRDKLSEILLSKEQKLLVGLDLPYKNSYLKLLRNSSFNYWNNWFSIYRFKIIKKLNKKKIYYNSDFSRFYNRFKDKSKAPYLINKIKKIWDNRDIVIVEGTKTRLGIGNDLLINAKSIKRIICPPLNAFYLYDKILKAALKISKDNLILIALGPTATVLAYDLTKYGYQAVDIGHTDIEYELYLRNATKIIPIPYKYVNEAKKGNVNISEVTDKNYTNQIIYKILY